VPLFIAPTVSCACHQQGLRITALVGIVGTCVGAWIKVFSVDPSLFYVSFIGQSIVALAQVCILSLPARLAAVWFGPDQVSSATSVGVFGNQVSGTSIRRVAVVVNGIL